MNKQTTIALILTAAATDPAMAHLFPKDFGTFTGLSAEVSDGAAHTGLNNGVEGNFGWIDGTDSDWGNSHDLGVYKFAITDAAADVRLSFQRKTNTSGGPGLIPGFTLYRGSVHTAPEPPDHDFSEGSLALRDADCAATPGCTVTEGAFRALDDFRITNEADPTGSDPSVMTYIGHAYDGPSQTIDGVLIGGADGVADGIVSLLFSNLSPGSYIAFVGGVNYASQTNHAARGVGGFLTISPTAVPVPAAFWLLGSGLAALLGRQLRANDRCA